MSRTYSKTKPTDTFKGSPYAAELLGSDDLGEHFRVPSASLPDYHYTVTLASDGEHDSCSCEAGKFGTLCWHVEAARLRSILLGLDANCRRHYATWTLAELQAEDARLRAVMVEHDGWLIRGQYSVLGDRVAELSAAQQAAA